MPVSETTGVCPLSFKVVFVSVHSLVQEGCQCPGAAILDLKWQSGQVRKVGVSGFPTLVILHVRNSALEAICDTCDITGFSRITRYCVIRIMGMYLHISSYIYFDYSCVFV